MQQDRPANSANAVALARAIETSHPAASRLFADPFAAAFLEPVPRVLARACRVPVLGGLLMALADALTPGARGNTLGRTRFIDDAVSAAAARGVDQVAILGAGYDCRPYRLGELRDASVFEVDHPATQARKRALLGRRLGTLPGNVTFVPIDFNVEPLGEALARAGFRSGCRNVFVWEGVTEYLSPEAVDATLRLVVATSAPESEIVFTYTDAGLIDGTRTFPGGRRLLALNRLGGEPYTFGLDPASLRSWLAERGLHLLEDVAGAEYARRYWEPLGRKVVGNEYERAVRARVRA